jgi:hypothetical protein
MAKTQDSDRSQAPLKDSGGVAVIFVITANTPEPCKRSDLNPWLLYEKNSKQKTNHLV